MLASRNFVNAQPLGRRLSHKLPQILSEPYTTLFDTEQEHRYFQLFSDKVSGKLSAYFDSPIWSQFVFQASQQDESIRRAIIAIGALEMTAETAYASHHIVPLAVLDQHHQFAIQQYGKSIKQMRAAISQQNQTLRTTLLTCLLIICFESLHGNHESSLAQMQSGLRLLESWAQNRTSSSNTSSAPALDRGESDISNVVAIGFKSPAPDIIEDEIVQAFGRLDMQANSFVDSRSVATHRILKDCGAESIARMPSTFSSINEAKVYWELVMRRLMHFISVANDYRAKFRPEVGDINDSSEGGILNRFILPTLHVSEEGFEEQRKHLNELSRWSIAFSPLLRQARLQPASKDFAGATVLRLRFVAAYIALSCGLSNTQTSFDSHINGYLEIITLAKILLAHPVTNTAFTFDLGFIAQLFVVGIKCRDSSIRRGAISLLLSKPWREGVWDSTFAGNVATAVMEIEEESRQGEIIPEYGRVRGTKMTFDLQERVGTLKCFLSCPTGEVIVKERSIKW